MSEFQIYGFVGACFLAMTCGLRLGFDLGRVYEKEIKPQEVRDER